jgi:hypothetical protein
MGGLTVTRPDFAPAEVFFTEVAGQAAEFGDLRIV